MNRFEKRISEGGLSGVAEKAAYKELDRLAHMQPSSAEYTVARTYVDWLVSLPWSVTTTDRLDLRKAKQVLDIDHYNLEKVKDRSSYHWISTGKTRITKNSKYGKKTNKK